MTTVKSSAHFPTFFSYLIAKIKINNLYKVENKSGLLTTSTFRRRIDILTEAEWRTKFASKVISKMTRLGIDRKELSLLSQISESALSRYVSGTRTPKADTVISLAKALECSVTELIQFGDTISK